MIYRRKDDVENKQAVINLIDQLETERLTAERCLRMGLNHLRRGECKVWGDAMRVSRKKAKALRVAIEMIRSCT
jgi:hypothetical protein